MNTTLLIMAAGIGSRFGGGVKQLTPVGPNNELIIDYSVFDAVEAGFNKIVFILRKDIEADFKTVIGDRLVQQYVNSGKCTIEYAYQDINDIPNGFTVPEGRTKPWGTGHAVLAAKELIHEPFAVINADDYYGKEAFVKIHDYLVKHANKQHCYCMAGFILENTLSENGGVTRGICELDENGCLIGIKETSNIVKTATGAAIEDAAVDGAEIDAYSLVSMNMWGLTPEFMDILEEGFVQFLDTVNGSRSGDSPMSGTNLHSEDSPQSGTNLQNGDSPMSGLNPQNGTNLQSMVKVQSGANPPSGVNPQKAEYLLPIIIDNLIKEGTVSVKVLETRDRWFGVTYAEDKQLVADSFRKLIEEGVYRSPLV